MMNNPSPGENGAQIAARANGFPRCVAIIGLFTLVIWYYFRGCNFWISTNDDLRFFCDSLSGPGTAFSVLYDVSLAQKRFHIGNFPFWYMAYAIDGPVAYSLIVVASLTANAIALGLLGVAISGKRSVWVVVSIAITYFLMLSNTYAYSAISFFSPIFVGAITLFSLSVYLFFCALHAPNQVRKRLQLVACFMCLLWPLLTYETFEALTPLYLMVYWLHGRSSGNRRLLLTPFGAQAFSVLAYAALRIWLPGQAYAGALLSSDVDVRGVAKTTVGFAMGALPIRNAVHGEMRWMRNVFFSDNLFLQPEPYFRFTFGALALTGCAIALRQTTPATGAGPLMANSIDVARKHLRSRLLLFALLFLYFFFIPGFLPALTEMYRSKYLSGAIIGNLSAFFSWNALVLLLGLLFLSALEMRTKFLRNALIAGLFAFLAVNSVCGFVNSQATSLIQKEGSDVIASMRSLAKTSLFPRPPQAQRIDVVSQDIGKNWFSLTYSGPATLSPRPGRGDERPKRSFWEYYFSRNAGDNVYFHETTAAVDPGEKFHHIRYIRDENRLGHAVTLVTSGIKVGTGSDLITVDSLRVYSDDPVMRKFRVRFTSMKQVPHDMPYCSVSEHGDICEISPSAPPSKDGPLYCYCFSRPVGVIGDIDPGSIEILW